MKKNIFLVLAIGFLLISASVMAMDADFDAVTEDDGADNCPMVYNPDQKDTDGDMVGDVCDSDIDGDGVMNSSDAAPYDSSIF